MRKLLWLCLLGSVSIPVLALDSVTTAQLDVRLAKLAGTSDKHAAQQISQFQLTDRPSRRQLAAWIHILPGEKSRTALLAVADAATFLAPSRSEILSDPSPDKKVQGEILLRATGFVNEESRRMPNFLAERVTTRFEDAERYPLSGHITYYTPNVYHLFDRRKAEVRFVAGDEEEIKSSGTAKKELDTFRRPRGLTTWGAFGPLLPIVMGDILASKVGWERWERSDSGRLAVFRFLVPQEQSHYTLEYCCVLDPKGDPTLFRAKPTYHGEVTIEPETGHVLRIVLVCDLAPGQVIHKASVELEYGPVEIAGQTYFLPLRGASASTVPSTKVRRIAEDGHQESDHFALTSINDLQFQNYKVFRSEMRIVAEQAPASGETNPAAQPEPHTKPDAQP